MHRAISSSGVIFMPVVNTMESLSSASREGVLLSRACRVRTITWVPEVEAIICKMLSLSAVKSGSGRLPGTISS